jgi:hypothetical protein
LGLNSSALLQLAERPQRWVRTPNHRMDTYPGRHCGPLRSGRWCRDPRSDPGSRIVIVEDVVDLAAGGHSFGSAVDSMVVGLTGARAPFLGLGDSAMASKLFSRTDQDRGRVDWGGEWQWAVPDRLMWSGVSFRKRGDYLDRLSCLCTVAHGMCPSFSDCHKVHL